jgi:type IV pilus assembly protein PilQ
MKKIFRIGIFTPLQILFFSLRASVFVTGFIFILSLGLSLPELNADSKLPPPDTQPSISMDFQDASLKDILKILSIQSNLNFIASEAVQDRKITLYLDKVPLQKAMDELFKANNLSYELDRDANIFIVNDWGKPEIETITRVYYLKYRSVPSAKLEKEKTSLFSTTGTDIVTSLKQVLSNNGKIAEDSSTNSLIITDIPIRFPKIESVIASLDVPQFQVMLDVEILDVKKDIVDKIGFEFGQTPLTVVITGATKNLGFPFSSWHKTFATTSSVGSAAINTGSSTYQVSLDFLRTHTDTKYLARPRLLTLNNETAEISITKDEVVGKKETTLTPTTGTTTTTVEYIRSTDLALTKEGTGIFLRVTPQINPKTDEITMAINPKSSITTTSTLFSTQADAEVRSTKSIVKVKNGETVILGGLIHTDKSVAIKKLPILGDIPFIGFLFRHKNQTKDIERELLVFITPHIIRDRDTRLAQTKKVTLPEREQNTATGFSREAEISTILDRFEKKSK